MRPLLRSRLSLGAIASVLALAMLGVGANAAAAKHPYQRQAPTSREQVHQGIEVTTGPAGCAAGLRSRYQRAQDRQRSLGARISRRCSSDAGPHRAPASGARPHPAPASGGGPQPSPAGPSSIYWGAWMGDQLTGEEAPWDMGATSKFEQMAGKKLSIVHFGSPFSNCGSRSCSFYDFPTDPMQHVREHGSIPFLSWSSQSIPTQTSEPNYQLSDITAGNYDSYIRKYAEDAAAWGHPFFLRFDWEMNGDWFPWAAGANGNNAAEYVAAWRHVHDIFTSVGATNATWVWCPNVDPDQDMESLASLYPGDSYVDWTGLDGYNWGTNPSSPQGQASFDHLYRSTYDEVVDEIAPSKPMIIGEVAASEYGGSKANWIADTLGKIPTEYPRIRGVLWFEKYDDGMDWPIETSSSATSAFAAGIQNPAYATNSFANLSAGGPIPPPSG